MFGKFSEQMQKTAQPATSLFEMNAKTLELVAQQQTALLSGVLDDSVKLIEKLSDQTELKGVLAAQSVYAESVRERMTSASKTTYSQMNTLRAEVTDLMKASLESVSEETKAAFAKAQEVASVAPAAPAKAAATKPAAKKPAAKKATAKKAAPAAKTATAPKAAESASKSGAAPKATTTKTVAKKPAAKKAVAKKPASAAVKTESQQNAEKATSPKAVADVSPADVKASDKN